jgi:predicted NBD/HSP70 family sugar kinase
MANYLTIDVGGTNIKYALMDENAEIAAKGEIPTP